MIRISAVKASLSKAKSEIKKTFSIFYTRLNAKRLDRIIAENASMPFTDYYSCEKYDPLLVVRLRDRLVSSKGHCNLELGESLARLSPKKTCTPLKKSAIFNEDSVEVIDELSQTGGYAKVTGNIPNRFFEPLIADLDTLEKDTSLDRSSARIQVSDWDILKNYELVQLILTDPYIKSIADEYLGLNSILNNVLMWKTVKANPLVHDDSKDALMYHFDSYANRFLKLFIYLSDVSRDNGPHVYIPRTSLRYRSTLPKKLQADRRFKDYEVLSSDVAKPVTLTGKAGTAFFADTHNLHKGTRVTGSPRYVLQFEFVDSVFGGKPVHSLEQMIEMNSTYLT